MPKNLTMKPKEIILSFILVVSQSWLFGQSLGYLFPAKSDRVTIPFEYTNNFIVINVMLQGYYPVKMIYDTGSQMTLITNPKVAEHLKLEYTRRFDVMGSDQSTTITTYLIKNVNLQMAKGGAPNQDILVLGEDYFNLEEFIGPNVQGIIGNDLFRHYKVLIDYRGQTLTLYKKREINLRRYETIPLEIDKYRPVVDAGLSFNALDTISAKLLLDTGAFMSLMVDADEEKGLGIPDETRKGRLGIGLGGELEGYIGRSQRLDLGPFSFHDFVTNFRIPQVQSDTIAAFTMIDGRDGLIGNEILKNFRCLFDFPNKLLHLRPYNKSYSDNISYDRSGMNLILTGENFDQILINHVYENTPASEAGLQKGDVLKRINGKSSGLFTYDIILRKFKSKANRTFRLKVIRDDEIVKAKFTLRDLI